MKAPSSKPASSSRSFSNTSRRSTSQDMPFYTSSSGFHFHKLSKADNLALKDKHYAKGMYWAEPTLETTKTKSAQDKTYFDLGGVTEEDVNFHWQRLFDSGFPWKDLHMAIRTLWKNGEISDISFGEWKAVNSEKRRQFQLWTRIVSNSGGNVEQDDLTEEEEWMIRFLSQAIIWMMAVDIRVGFPAATDFIRGFGHPVMRSGEPYEDYTIYVGDAIRHSKFCSARTALEADIDSDNDVLVILLLDDLTKTPEVYGAKLDDELMNHFEKNYESLLKSKIPGQLENRPESCNGADDDNDDRSIEDITVILLVKNLKTPLEPHEIRYSNVCTCIKVFRKRVQTVLMVHAADEEQIKEDTVLTFKRLQDAGVELLPPAELIRDVARAQEQRYGVPFRLNQYHRVEVEIDMNWLVKAWEKDYDGMVVEGLTSQEVISGEMGKRLREKIEILKTAKGCLACRDMEGGI